MIKTTTLTKKLVIQKFKLEDSKSLLGIYNQSVIQGHTGTNKKVKLKTHQKWLEKKKLSKNDLIFVGKLNKIIIGYVRFENINFEKCIVSIALKRQFVNRGYGSKLLNRSIANLVKIKRIKKIECKVKKINVNSAEFFLKNNFKEIINTKKKNSIYRYFKLSLKY